MLLLVVAALSTDEISSQNVENVLMVGSEESIELWRERIREVGPVPAYRELVAALTVNNGSATVFKQHVAAHYFGDALYQEVGPDGFSVCDGRFSYGCEHVLVGRTIADYSTSALGSLKEHCITLSGYGANNCLHGLGHGILGYLGYDRESLLEALRLCDEVGGSSGILGGCYAGVFMEYNLRSLLLDEGYRPVPGDNFLDPCDSLGGRARLSCFSRLPQWWWELPELKTENAFTLLASRCRDLASSGDERAACAFGVGRQIGSMQQIAEANTARSLSALPGLCQVFRSDRDRGWCLAGAVKRLQEVFPFTLPRGYCSSIGSEFQGPCSALLTAEAGTWYEFEDTEFSAIR